MVKTKLLKDLLGLKRNLEEFFRLELALLEEQEKEVSMYIDLLIKSHKKTEEERAILKITGDLWIVDFFEDQEILNIVM